MPAFAGMTTVDHHFTGAASGMKRAPNTGSLCGVGGSSQAPVEGGRTSASTWTSSTNGLFALTACSRAALRSCDFVTVMASTPQDFASAAKSGLYGFLFSPWWNMVPCSRPPNMPSWMSRIETQPKLFQITQTTGMLYSTAVHSTCGTMVKQPSPVTATTGRSGAASLAPSAPAAPKPMPEKTQQFSMFCGCRGFQNCMYQLWLTPTSQHRMASGGSTAAQSATIRSGLIGEALISKFGRTKSSHLDCHVRTSAIQAFVASRFGLRLSISASNCLRNVRASAITPMSGG